MEIRFTAPGPPKGKQRPRVCRINGKSITYTPKQTTEYEKKIRASYKRLKSEKFPQGVPLKINITALFPIPKKFNKEWRQTALNGKILPTKKPDSDNIIKIILDGLNGVAYHDDAQICKVNFEKRYAEIPEVKVTIKEINL